MRESRPLHLFISGAGGLASHHHVSPSTQCYIFSGIYEPSRSDQVIQTQATGEGHDLQSLKSQTLSITLPQITTLQMRLPRAPSTSLRTTTTPTSSHAPSPLASLSSLPPLSLRPAATRWRLWPASRRYCSTRRCSSLTASRTPSRSPLSATQRWVGDDQRIPGVVCFLDDRFLPLPSTVTATATKL